MAEFLKGDPVIYGLQDTLSVTRLKYVEKKERKRDSRQRQELCLNPTPRKRKGKKRKELEKMEQLIRCLL